MTDSPDGMLIAMRWRDYSLIDCGGGEKLERWGEIITSRPDPQAIWPSSLSKSVWDACHMRYLRNNSGGGSWELNVKKASPAAWTINYGDLKFKIRPTDFKHMGLFPEQAPNWDFVSEQIKKRARKTTVLNLFGYTGGATVACAAAGAEVTHVDSAKGMNQWAKENIELSNLSGKPCRLLVDDAVKFVMRETRRGNKYDAIIMDPPVYGRGPSGELWKLADRLYGLIDSCAKLLSDDPAFLLLNVYTSGYSPRALENTVKSALKVRVPVGRIDCGELGLRAEAGDAVLPCGAFVRYVPDRFNSGPPRFLSGLPCP
ncbi:MAG: class I SAM-dependent methyltransferase [Defluviitaleaceae bacterium]|nr:class I SAM-dependent methyltransferase [Defluviitaleaceae bacterium]